MVLNREISLAAMGVVMALVLSSCAQPITSTTAATSLAGGNIELDPTITPEQYQNALRQVKGLLLNSPFLSLSEQQISSLDAYRNAVENYLDHPSAPLAIQKLYRQILQMEGTEAVTNFSDMPQIVIDNDEPSSLAAAIFANDDDFRKMVTGTDCYSNAESGSTLKANCQTRGRFNKTQTGTTNPAQFFSMVTPIEQRAGAISTQGFLKKYGGALNFRRPSKVHEFFLCSAHPDTSETSGWTEQSGELHPFYWTQAGNEQNCQSCHQALNKARSFFTGFGTLGEMQMGQSAPRISDNAMVNVDAKTINDVESATINLPDYVALYGKARTEPFESTPTIYHGQVLSLENFNPGRMGNPSYVTLSQFGAIIAENDRFANCTAQRFYNFAMGINQSYLNALPSRLSEVLPNTLKNSNYNLKTLLLEVFSTSDFLNR